MNMIINALLAIVIVLWETPQAPEGSYLDHIF